ncbi:MAG TPA: hypothetical protein VFQ67_05915 [Allosphingosinicella sp.]|jgi:hypothetical protein|nr:hypothetical protein [Allosphingosinicella sp.]
MGAGAKAWGVAAAAAALLAAGTAEAKWTKPGFSLPAGPKRAVLVPCPDLFVGTRNSRGEERARADWTERARANLAAALRAGPVGRAVELRFGACDEPSALLDEARSTVNFRNSDLLFKVPPGTFPRPGDGAQALKGLKRLKGRYEYGIGADLVARLRSAYGDADYGLFLTMHDGYSTPGDKAGRIAGAFIGIPFVLPPHYANSMLVDLRSGAILWTHMDGAVGGDLRDPDEAGRRMEQATRGFPGTE